MEVKINDDGTALIDGVVYVQKSKYEMEVSVQDMLLTPGKYYALETEEGRKKYEQDVNDTYGRPEAKADAKVELNDNPLFYPKKGKLAAVLNSMADRFLNAKVITHTSCDDIIAPRLKPETAERVAWGMSRLAEWQAMGVGIGEDGERRWFAGAGGYDYFTHNNKQKSVQDALFLTQEDLIEALEKFGGFKALLEARLARWGK